MGASNAPSSTRGHCTHRSEGLSFYLNVADVLPELGGEDDQLGDVDAVAGVGGAVVLQVRNLHPRNLVLEEPAKRETDSLS